MKLIMKPIAVVAAFDEEGKSWPIKFRYRDEQENAMITVNRILVRKQEKIAGNLMLVFLCQSSIHEQEVRFEIKYEVRTQKWFLSKM